jgi:hypothetical protein
LTTNIQARDALVTETLTRWAASTFSAVPVYWEAGPPPAIDTLVEFVYASVTFVHAEQASIEAVPITRVQGTLNLTFFGKEPNGDRRPAEMAEFLCDALKHRNIGGVATSTPRPAGKEDHDGWYSTNWAIPFWHHK